MSRVDTQQFDHGAIVAEWLSGKYASQVELANAKGVSRQAVTRALNNRGIYSGRHRSFGAPQIAEIERLAREGLTMGQVRHKLNLSRERVSQHWPSDVERRKPVERRHVPAVTYAPVSAAAIARVGGEKITARYHAMNLTPSDLADGNWGRRWSHLPARPVYEPPTRESPGPWQL